MLLEFTVGNFLSFKEKKTLNLTPANIKELPNNVLSSGKYSVLNGAVIYGANSSGKSNFIEAFRFMQETILNSSKLNSVDQLGVTPFLLSTETENQPSYFELVVLEDGQKIRYGFEIDNQLVHSEWLYCQFRDADKEDVLFVRNKDEIAVSRMFELHSHVEAFIERTNDNALFLAVCDTWGVELPKVLIRYISKIKVLSGITHEKECVMTLNMLRDSDTCDSVKTLLRRLQLGFKNIAGYEESDSMFKIRTIHDKYDGQGNIVGNQEFKMKDSESAGTNKIFDIVGYILYGLIFGKPVIIDELDAKLHPLLTIEIIRMFNSKESNPRGGQLIFVTHDTNLLSNNLFRRDQIWFAEKDRLEATDLYSLVEFKGTDNRVVRNDRSFEADYIKGRYGAIPYIR